MSLSELVRAITTFLHGGEKKGFFIQDQVGRYLVVKKRPEDEISYWLRFDEKFRLHSAPPTEGERARRGTESLCRPHGRYPSVLTYRGDALQKGGENPPQMIARTWHDHGMIFDYREVNREEGTVLRSFYRYGEEISRKVISLKGELLRTYRKGGNGQWILSEEPRRQLSLAQITNLNREVTSQNPSIGEEGEEGFQTGVNEAPLFEGENESLTESN